MWGRPSIPIGLGRSLRLFGAKPILFLFGMLKSPKPAD
jgi:hypothetical protein